MVNLELTAKDGCNTFYSFDADPQRPVTEVILSIVDDSVVLNILTDVDADYSGISCPMPLCTHAD